MAHRVMFFTASSVSLAIWACTSSFAFLYDTEQHCAMLCWASLCRSVLYSAMLCCPKACYAVRLLAVVCQPVLKTGIAIPC